MFHIYEIFIFCFIYYSANRRPIFILTHSKHIISNRFADNCSKEMRQQRMYCTYCLFERYTICKCIIYKYNQNRSICCWHIQFCTHWNQRQLNERERKRRERGVGAWFNYIPLFSFRFSPTKRFEWRLFCFLSLQSLINILFICQNEDHRRDEIPIECKTVVVINEYSHCVSCT